ncbi:hypothetical protein Gotri_025554 [Gossypium trilobum]|uniref:Cytochrome P450 CYP749A22-like n=1 Tax=Gossypium trilobum TaxID=34281 RepID=A0A7J9FXT8_9ROSI|nr:hypothetical protein [Gossypium trilobum]
MFTSEVISRTAFGSSYLEGEKIFYTLKKLADIVSRNSNKSRISILSKFWKTDDDVESEKLAREIQDLVIEIVKKRENEVASGEAESFGSDFLRILVKAFNNPDEKNKILMEDLVDECKTFYFAGQETVNALLAWAVLVLAIHRDWQDKARREMRMIINETLRLYAPINGLVRRARRQVQVGKLVLPAKVDVWIPNMALHHDPQLWGDDAHVFKPERFEKGIVKATKYNAAAFIPFGMGPRACVGMTFAINETKTALSMILQRYTISLSPAYVHQFSLSCLCSLTHTSYHSSTTAWDSSYTQFTV